MSEVSGRHIMTSEPDARTLKRALIQARPYWPHILLLLTLSLLATPIALLKPYALKFLIDCGFDGQRIPGFLAFVYPGDKADFAAVAIMAAVIAVCVALLDHVNSFCSWLLGAYTGEKLVRSFRAVLFDHVQRLSLAYHDDKGVSDSLYRIQWDTTAVRSLLLSQLPPLITATFTLCCMVVVMFGINVMFALIACAVILPLFFISKVSRKKLKKHYYEVKAAESSAVSVVNEVLSSLKVVKVFGREERENDRFTDRSEHALKSQLNLTRASAGYSLMVGMLLAIGLAAFLYTGANLVHSGQMTLGELTLVLAYLSQIFTPLQSIVKNLNEIQSSFAGIERVFKVLSEEREVAEVAGARPMAGPAGAFEFREVCFRYRQGEPTLQDLSFTIRPGDRVGIMGATGAGKSTLISLLLRLYDPTEGSIFVDGVDIRSIKLADYRSQFAIVLQEPVLFSTSIEENIRYGNPAASEREVMDSAIAANAHNFIMQRGEGYQTLVGERGVKLSGGERQRISIARAFIKNAPVLILDEPTSSLDLRTEALIMDAMERLMEGRTTFMITHRLDTLSGCNVLLHLDRGRLVEVVRDHDAGFLERSKAVLLNR